MSWKQKTACNSGKALHPALKHLNVKLPVHELYRNSICSSFYSKYTARRMIDSPCDTL